MTEILVIDGPHEGREKLARIIAASMPGVQVNEYDPLANGIPDPDIDLLNQDLILLNQDLGIKNQDGFDWLRSLKESSNTPPVIMLLNTGDTNSVSNALRMGAANYIVRDSLDPATIHEKISETLDHSFLMIAGDDDIIDITSETALVDSEDEDITVIESPKDNGGLSIPGYLIKGEIAKGGMATVLLATREEDDLEVILKVMFLDGHENQQALKLFIQEYKMISNIEHPHIIRIYERAFASDFAYIAMEYFPNGDLSHRIRQGIAPGKALEYLKQIALGLGAAHQLNIVHRDLKPGNILFRNDDTLTITDFGVAKFVSQDDEDAPTSEAIVGTPYYLSPEQSHGLASDQRSDLYSLGIIFYEMLTGKRPYVANNLAKLVYAHRNNPIPVLRGELAKYQPLIDGLLAKEPNERFQNTNELLIGIDWVK